MPTYSKDRPHYNVAIFVLVRNDHGECLLQQRKNTSYMNGYWDFSGSGHLEHGETIKQCIVRETEEECGLKLSEEDLTLVQILQHDVGDWPYIDLLFVCDTASGEVATNETEKVSALRWFKPENFPEKLTLALHAYKNAGFPTDELNFTYVNEDDHARITGKKYENDAFVVKGIK